MAIKIYRYKKEHYPDNLKELINYFNKSENDFFMSVKTDDMGYPLDPFDSKYIYDKEKFIIKSVNL